MTCPASAAWTAFRSVTLHDMLVTRALIALRALDVASLDASRPFIDLFEEAGFQVLVERPPQLLVAAAAGPPWRIRGGRVYRPKSLQDLREFAEPGYVKIAFRFEVDAAPGPRRRVWTETLVEPTDDDTARAFARYWAVIRLGSQAIRADVLRAVRRRCQDPLL